MKSKLLILPMLAALMIGFNQPAEAGILKGIYKCGKIAIGAPLMAAKSTTLLTYSFVRLGMYAVPMEVISFTQNVIEE